MITGNSKMRGDCFFVDIGRIVDPQCLNFLLFISSLTSVDTEMCCPKGKCGCQYFILLTLKKKIDGHSPVFLFQIFIIVPLPSPSQGI